jgi:purine-nucleoside/S-methyl-5'-thioadenosine phosphorylase / adenosine deaminase
MTSTSLPSSSNAAPSSILGPALVRWSGRGEGDLGPDAGEGVATRRQSVQPGPWAWLRQVHGADVRVVTAPGGVQGVQGDALVTTRPGVVLAVFTADCAPVALASPEGVVALAHAGWKGAEAGVVEETAEVMRAHGATRIEACLGPCIRPCCYEFGPADLDRLAARFGPGVRGRTRAGRPSLDLPATVAAALGRVGVTLVHDHGGCTACTDGWFSHRARRETARQATVVVVPA